LSRCPQDDVLLYHEDGSKGRPSLVPEDGFHQALEEREDIGNADGKGEHYNDQVTFKLRLRNQQTNNIRVYLKLITINTYYNNTKKQ